MRVGDLLILVVCIAVGLALTPPVEEFSGPTLFVLVNGFMPTLVPLGMTLTAGLLVVTWRHAPAPRRLAFERPGAAACLTVLTTFAIFIPLDLAQVVQFGGEYAGMGVTGWWPDVIRTKYRLGGVAVVAAWVPMILSGRWRPEPTATDRLGRLVGVAWLAASMAYEYWGFD